MNRPLLDHVGIMAVVPDAWTDVSMPRHKILARLSRYFQVVWMDPAREWRDLLRSRVSEEWARPVPDHLHIYRPTCLPIVYRPAVLGSYLERLRYSQARRKLRRLGCSKLVLYLWRPTFEAAVSADPYDAICYHIDDEYTFSMEEIPIPAAERRLIERADRVFIHSPALMEKKGSINPNTICIPNGVDYRAFATQVDEPLDLRGIPRPRIGYCGVLKRQLDWVLLQELAERHAGWSFVFVGPLAPHDAARSAVETLGALPNVHFLGGKAEAALSAYPQHFDVCIMPYAVDDYTRYIYPLKLHEYLASGTPVVGSPIHSLEGFSDVVQLPASVEQWPAALAAALRPEERAKESVSRRRAVAEQHDWNHLVQSVARSMVSALGPEYVARLERAIEIEAATSIRS